MNKGLAMVLWTIGAATGQVAAQASCGDEVRAAATAHRLSDLPQDIRNDLGPLGDFFGDEIADSDARLLGDRCPHGGQAELSHHSVCAGPACR